MQHVIFSIFIFPKQPPLIFCHPQANCFHRRLPTATGGVPVPFLTTPKSKGKKEILKICEKDNNDNDKDTVINNNDWNNKEKEIDIIKKENDDINDNINVDMSNIENPKNSNSSYITDNGINNINTHVNNINKKNMNVRTIIHSSSSSESLGEENNESSEVEPEPETQEETDMSFSNESKYGQKSLPHHSIERKIDGCTSSSKLSTESGKLRCFCKIKS